MYNKIAIVRKIDDGMASSVSELADTIHLYGEKKNIPVFDYHLGTDLLSTDEDILFVSLGGDGTLLYAADLSMQYTNAGVVGFNLGNLGFLTEDVGNHKAVLVFIAHVMKHDLEFVKPDPRMMLECVIHRDGMRHWDGTDRFYAMNEITLYTSLRNFVDTKVAINSMLACTYGGNGAAVTTATGSTALGLSAGGAIINPSATVMQVVPLLPHKVAKQPIVTSGRDDILLRAQTSVRTQKLYVLADSRQLIQVDYEKDQRFLDVSVRRADKDVMIWRPKSWNFFDVLSRKMEWH
jgi:NAD+ kinase